MKPVNYQLNKLSCIRFSLHQLWVAGLLLLLLGSFTRTTAQTAVIPDPNFRQFLTQMHPQVMDANGQLIIAEATKIDFLDCENRKIADLSGIQYFTGLRTLRCYGNQLTNLPDISGIIHLQELVLDFNNFSTFPDVSKNVGLRTIFVNFNQLSSLPDLSSLTQLYDFRLMENKFTTFPAAALASNVNLYDIDFRGNQISSLPDLSHFKNLGVLGMEANQLTALPDLSKLTKLEMLFCASNRLTQIPDLSHNLELSYLDIRDNFLTAFPDISANLKLRYISCSANSVGSLPDLSQHTELTDLYCYGNGLTSLPDLSNNRKLENLVCNGNYLTSLPDLSNNTKLYFLNCGGNKLTALPDLSNTTITKLECWDNQLTSIPNLPPNLPLETFLAELNYLTFEDILPLLPFKANAYTRTALQHQVGAPKTVYLKRGDSYTIDLNIDNDIPDNQYQWVKINAQDNTMRPNKTIFTPTNENKFTITSMTPADTGSYTCVITNPRVATQILQLSSYRVKIMLDEPWVPVTSGGDNHVIVIPNNIATSINGKPIAIGDYIGVFFDNSSGKLVNGGIAKWTGDHITLNAWSSTGAPKNGFLASEAFQIKVWRASDRKEYTVNATYDANAPYTHAGSFAANGFSSIKSLGTAPVCVKQVITLHAGWNLISINVQPDNLAMSAIFAGKQEVLVKDAAGRIQYAPQNGITSGTWNITEGYKVLVPTSQTLTLCGTKIDPQTAISIPNNSYPYFLPYFASVSMPVTSGLNSLGTNFSFAQSNEYRDGSAVLNAYNYLPAHVISPAIDQIGTMQPGLAYKVSMTSAVAAFRYPSVAGGRVNGESQVADVSVSHYTLPNITTGNNALLVVTKDAFGQAIAEGDEIAVFTENGTLAGAGRYLNENMVITVWENEGMKSGESYHLKVWKQDTQEELAAQVSYEKGNGQYVSNSVQMVKQARLAVKEVAAAAQQVVIYPNPASEFIGFQSAVHQTGAVVVSLHNLMGNKLVEVSQSSLEAVEINVNHLPAGQYVCVIKANGQESRSKISVVK